MAEKTHYEILGVARGAGEDEVYDHFRDALYKYHPDHNPGQEEWAVDQTVLLNKAYRVLNDPVARKTYDFEINNRFKNEGQVKGLSLLKSKTKKEAEAQFARGVTAFQNDNRAQAVEFFKSAIKLEPTFSDASFNLAYLGTLLGNAMFSMGVLDKAIKADPKEEALIRLRINIHKAFLG